MSLVEGKHIIKKLFHYTNENINNEDAVTKEGESWVIDAFTTPTLGIPFICYIPETENALRTTMVLSIFEKDTENDKLIVPPEFVNLVIDQEYDMIFATRNSVYGILKIVD